LTLWQYTALVEEHNIKTATEVHVEAPTQEWYDAELAELRERGDPSIQV
jgi:hypothetical protein